MVYYTLMMNPWEKHQIPRPAAVRGAMTILLLSTFRPLLGTWRPSPYLAACSARLANYLEVSRSAVRKMAYGPSVVLDEVWVLVDLDLLL